uniref:Carrier domain-containing protein n=1 Tax=Zooxanthella nutricula TaxID=1333877 RepID=A0A7S2QE16_9DINO|mmetsp:Transcript_86990/g.266312  ORF Transcript_86990/g.266312 Transcript_86990/m.266312 type:complete len:430 (+) Transcript_86990:3-1292(+)
MLNQHLARKPFKIRFAELDDLPELERLEATAWQEELAAPREVLRRRLETSPTTCLACEYQGRVAAVLYMQRIDSLDVVDTQSFLSLSETHSPKGRILQLITICTDPAVQHMGIGFDLRSFAVHWARVDPSIDSVVGVTRTRDYFSYPGTMQDYVDKHIAGELTDAVLDFHTSFGAEIVKLVPNFRPEDVDNGGVGVLIQYNKVDIPGPRAVARIEAQQATQSLDLIMELMEDIGYKLDRSMIDKGFFDYGMDSLELVRIRNKLSHALSMELPATLLLDCPTVGQLAMQLDKDRGLEAQEQSEQEEEEVLPDGGRRRWDTITGKDLLEILERCKRIYALPQYQRKFTELSKKCYPDMLKYIMFIESVCVEVEGAVFQEFGLLVDRSSWESVQAARHEMMRATMKFWIEVPDLRTANMEVLHITKQDQKWN